MFMGSAPFSLLGVYVATQLKHHYGTEATEKMGYILGAALLFGATGLVLKSFLGKTMVGRSDKFDMTRRDRVAALAIGIAGGFIVGLTSVGSGTFFGLVMLLVFPLTAAKIVGTDIFHAAALLWVAGISHLVHGNVDVGAMGWLLLGSIPGVLLASKFTVRVPEGALRVSLGAVLTASGVRLLELPGYELIVPAVLAAGGVLAVFTEVRRIQARGGPATEY